MTENRPPCSLEDFDLNLLRVLDALLEARSVSGAARRLDLSQPAASAALARLRLALGDPLLVRHGNGMTATPLAEELRPRVGRILEDVRAALGAAVAFDPATTSRRFRIGANDYATLTVLVAVAAWLRHRAPRATLEILPRVAMPETGLAEREVDLVLSDGYSLRDVRTKEVLFHEDFVSIARRDHPRLGKRVTLDRFVAEDHALLSVVGLSPGALDDALAALGRSRRVALTLPHYTVAPAVIARTDLVMTLPGRIAARYAIAEGLRTFKPPLPVNGFDLVMAWHPRSAAEPAVQWLMALVRDAAKGEAISTGKTSR